jgi:hypothetical protein
MTFLREKQSFPAHIFVSKLACIFHVLRMLFLVYLEWF